MSKYTSPHLRNAAAKNKHSQPKEGESAKSKVGGAATEHDGGAAEHTQHTSETHGTQPHPVTGVHAVHMHHMGGGKFQSHTHHDGGGVETQQHDGEQAAQQHVAESFPTDERDPQDEQQMGPPTGGDLSGLGGSYA